MCNIFLHVAKLYIEAKTKEAAEQRQNSQGSGFYPAASSDQAADDMTAMNQFDPYLSALGLMPNSAWPMANSFPAMPPGMEAFQGLDGAASAGYGAQNTVQDWFSGSRYIMGLMEDDINMPDLGTQ